MTMPAIRIMTAAAMSLLSASCAVSESYQYIRNQNTELTQQRDKAQNETISCYRGRDEERERETLLHLKALTAVGTACRAPASSKASGHVFWRGRVASNGGVGVFRDAEVDADAFCNEVAKSSAFTAISLLRDREDISLQDAKRIADAIMALDVCGQRPAG